MFDNAKKVVKKIVAGMLASVAIVIPSAKFVQKQLEEAPERDGKKEEQVNDEDISYDDVYKELGVDVKDPSSLETPEIDPVDTKAEIEIGEDEIIINTEDYKPLIESEEDIVETEVNVGEAVEDFKNEEFIEDIEVETDTNTNIVFLESILETKKFEESMKKEIIDTYKMIEQNYDSVYAYKKIPKADYLKMFCDTVSKKLETAELVEEQDAGTSYAKVLDSKGAIGLTDGETIYLMVDEIARVESNLAHEIEHLNNQYFNVLIGDAGIDIGLVIREGMSARAEDLCENLGKKEITMGYAGPGKDIYMDKEIIQRGDEEVKEYVAVYQTYENFIERLEALLGMEKLTEMVHSQEEFVTNLRKELCKEFSKDKVDEFITSFIVSTCFVNDKGINAMSQIPDRISSINANISRNWDLLNSTPEELEAKLRQEIVDEGSQLTMYENYLISLENNSSMGEQEKASAIKQVKCILSMFKNSIEIKNEMMKNYVYEDKIDELKFEMGIDERKAEAFENYQQNQYDTIWDVLINLENSFNNLILERINNIKDASQIGEIKALCADYYQNVMISCCKDGEDITNKNFESTVAKALQEKEKEFGKISEVEIDSFEMVVDMDFGGR